MGAAFSPYSPSGANLCFFGVPVQVGLFGGPSCICNEGFVFDFVLFHDQSCTMPEHSVAGFFAASTIITFAFCAAIVWLIWPIAPSTKLNQARKQGLVTLVYLAFNYSMVVSIYAQNGWYEAASLMSFFALCAQLVASSMLVTILLKPSFAMERKVFEQMKRRIDAFFFTIGVLYACLASVQAALSRGDPTSYNNVVLGYFALLSLIASLGPLLVADKTSGLIRTIEGINAMHMQSNDTVPSDTVGDVLNRLRKIRLATIGSAVNSLCVILPYLTCHAVIGSAPFSWAFLMVCQLMQTALQGGSAIFVLHRRSQSSSSSSSPGKSPNKAHSRKLPLAAPVLQASHPRSSTDIANVAPANSRSMVVDSVAVVSQAA